MDYDLHDRTVKLTGLIECMDFLVANESVMSKKEKGDIKDLFSLTKKTFRTILSNIATKRCSVRANKNKITIATDDRSFNDFFILLKILKSRFTISDLNNSLSDNSREDIYRLLGECMERETWDMLKGSIYSFKQEGSITAKLNVIDPDKLSIYIDHRPVFEIGYNYNRDINIYENFKLANRIGFVKKILDHLNSLSEEDRILLNKYATFFRYISLDYINMYKMCQDYGNGFISIDFIEYCFNEIKTRSGLSSNAIIIKDLIIDYRKMLAEEETQKVRESLEDDLQIEEIDIPVEEDAIDLDVRAIDVADTFIERTAVSDRSTLRYRVSENDPWSEIEIPIASTAIDRNYNTYTLTPDQLAWEPQEAIVLDELGPMPETYFRFGPSEIISVDLDHDILSQDILDILEEDEE